jgi:hypothetical protein
VEKRHRVEKRFVSPQRVVAIKLHSLKLGIEKKIGERFAFLENAIFF